MERRQRLVGLARREPGRVAVQPGAGREGNTPFGLARGLAAGRLVDGVGGDRIVGGVPGRRWLGTDGPR
jgi:hypothetical protein